MFQECLDFYIIKSMSDWMKKKKKIENRNWKKNEENLIMD